MCVATAARNGGWFPRRCVKRNHSAAPAHCVRARPPLLTQEGNSRPPSAGPIPDSKDPLPEFGVCPSAVLGALLRSHRHRFTAAVVPALFFVELARIVEAVRLVKLHRLQKRSLVIRDDIDHQRVERRPANPLDHV